MPAGSYNILVEQGADFSQTVTWTLDAAGTPKDITGYTGKLDIRDAQDINAPLVFRFKSAPGAGEGTITVGGTTGVITITASAALTGPLAAHPGLYYDLEMTSPAGFVTRLLQGKCVISAQVTN